MISYQSARALFHYFLTPNEVELFIISSKTLAAKRGLVNLNIELLVRRQHIVVEKFSDFGIKLVICFQTVESPDRGKAVASSDRKECGPTITRSKLLSNSTDSRASDSGISAEFSEVAACNGHGHETPLPQTGQCAVAHIQAL